MDTQRRHRKFADQSAAQQYSVLAINHTAVMGGAEHSFLDVIRGLEMSVCVLLFEDGELRRRLLAEGLPVLVVEGFFSLARVKRKSNLLVDLSGSPALFALALKVSRVARDHDVLYANSQKSLFVAVLAGVIARKPVVWHQRDILDENHFNSWHRRLVARACNLGCAGVIANSKATGAALIRAGVRPILVQTVYNGVDASSQEELNTADDDIVEFIRRRSARGDFVVGLIGRIAPWKGQHILLAAMADLPNVSAVVVGDALFGEHSYFVSLRDFVKRFGLDERVLFAGFRSDAQSVMAKVDAVVHSSVAPEAFGRVIIEGMLAKKPVIAARDGGVIEIITDPEFGWLYEPGNPNDLAASIRSVIADADQRQKVAISGYVRASSKFSRTSMIDGVRAALVSFVDRYVSRTNTTLDRKTRDV